MQFNSNSDYPEAEARQAPPFTPAVIEHSACITTRVFFPRTHTVETVSNVLVKTDLPPYEVDLDGNRIDSQATNAGVDDDSFFSYMSSCDGSVDTSKQTGAGAKNTSENEHKQIDRAFWIQRTLRDAIYGKVKYAVVLKRIDPNNVPPNQVVEWEVTNEACAIKEQSWQQIRRDRHRFAENPLQEVAAMQYLYNYYKNINAMQQNNHLDIHRIIVDSHVMMPIDILTDDRFLYCVMPYCNGGELFDRLDQYNKLPEDECRYWLDQILTAVETLQKIGICHRDLSLENLLVHNDKLCLIIDLGMCIRVPFQNDPQTQNIIDHIEDMTLDIEPTPLAPGATFAASAMEQNKTVDDQDFSFPQAMNNLNNNERNRRRERYLIKPSGTCGKAIYMAPEIEQNEKPFDGFAVDMWAVGIILFLMLTGFNPWERPCSSDERFLYMTNGYLVQMLSEWNLGLSPDVLDLLQRMLWIDPKDRLSLEQVRAHPWMLHGRRAPPAIRLLPR